MNKFHFEELWNKAEELSAKAEDNRQLLDVIKSIQENFKNLAFSNDKIESHTLFGIILYEMCIVSRMMNINSYSSLDIIISNIEKRFSGADDQDEDSEDSEDI